MFFEGKCMVIEEKKRVDDGKGGFVSREKQENARKQARRETQRKGLSSFFPSWRRANLKQVAGFRL